MNIEKRHNTWYAVLTVPPDVRPILGKLRLVKSTQTGDKAKARQRAAVLVAQWKADIEKARGTLPDPNADYWENLRRDFLRAKETEGDDGTQSLAIMDAIEEAVGKIKDPEESSLRWKVATGILPPPLPLVPLVAAWKGSLRLAQKTIDQQARDVGRTAEHFGHLEALTPQKVKEWTDKLLAEGVTASSFERIGNGCRSFWTYLQHSGTKAMIDPDPFVGPFKLAMRVAANNKVGRTDFSAEDLARVYAAAVAQKDQPLADLIALGAYTGARIEELCQLTRETVKDGVFIIERSKTEAGVRHCPIHPALGPLVARMVAASTDGFLVPSSAKNQYGNRSGPLSQRFGHLKTALGFGKEHVFHSTRRTLVTLMERGGVPEGIAADVAGHEKKTMTYGLYSGGSAMKQKLEAISKVSYPAPLDNP